VTLGGQTCPELTWFNDSFVTCYGLDPSKFTTSGATAKLGGETASLGASGFEVFGTPYHSVLLGGNPPTGSASTLVLEASNVGNAPSDIVSIRVGLPSSDMWFNCTSIDVQLDDTDATKRKVSCRLSGGGGANLEVRITHIGGRHSPSNQQVSFVAPRVQSMSPDTAPPTGGDFVLTGTNLGNPALGVIPTDISMGGKPCGTIELISSTELHCNGVVANGDYSATSVELAVVNQRAVAPIFKFEGAPTILSVTPATGPVEGGTVLTITGTDLGNSATIASITISERNCTSITVVQVDTEVQCTTPPGVGTNVVFKYQKTNGVHASGIGLFSYGIPVVSRISPGVVLSGTQTLDFTIFGSSLASTLDAPSEVAIGGRPCGSISVLNSSAIECLQVTTSLSSPWQSTVVSLKVGGDTVQQSGLLRSLGTPIIRSISPPSIDSGGGERITITGVDLGFTASSISNILVNGRSCTDLKLQSDTTVSCIAPRGLG